MAGLQDAFWRLGGVPEVLRSDNLSAATHELPSGGRELNQRFAQVLAHYQLRSTRIEPGKSETLAVELTAGHSRSRRDISTSSHHAPSRRAASRRTPFSTAALSWSAAPSIAAPTVSVLLPPSRLSIASPTA